ncbi:hypothetical protein CF319_g876 [Tilletia indica]|nr:hypothetical protein CF319_g876 [Tilletia indica]
MLFIDTNPFSFRAGDPITITDEAQFQIGALGLERIRILGTRVLLVMAGTNQKLFGARFRQEFAKALDISSSLKTAAVLIPIEGSYRVILFIPHLSVFVRGNDHKQVRITGMASILRTARRPRAPHHSIDVAIRIQSFKTRYFGRPGGTTLSRPSKVDLEVDKGPNESDAPSWTGVSTISAPNIAL